MSTDVPETPALDRMLERLNSGDPEAAAEMFRTYEPLLRMLVRRQLRPALRAKFDSGDVVQSVWADVVEGLARSGWNFKTSEQLRGFLVRLARNRLIDRCRTYRAALQHEEPLTPAGAAQAPPDTRPRASDVARGAELWDRLLTLCPPAHRDVLLLRREGYRVEEIAERTGLHPSSVRRIMYELARRLERSTG